MLIPVLNIGRAASFAVNCLKACEAEKKRSVTRNSYVEASLYSFGFFTRSHRATLLTSLHRFCGLSETLNYLYQLSTGVVDELFASNPPRKNY